LLAAAYSIVGIVRWPRSEWRDAFLNRASIDAEAFGSFRLSRLALTLLPACSSNCCWSCGLRRTSGSLHISHRGALIACFSGFGLGSYLTRPRVSLLSAPAPPAAMVALIELRWSLLRHQW